MDHLQTVQEIFTARFLRVPDYQRGFAWERKHCLDLLEDLELLDGGGEHYTGTLVLHRVSGAPPIMDEEGREHGVFDIVDGQQRLTTIVLLLDAIRRELPEGSPLAAGIKKTYVLTRDLDGKAQPKLALNRDTHAFYSRNIIADLPSIDGPQIRSERLLKDAHGYFRAHLRDEIGKRESGDAWLIGLHKKVTNGLKLTVYEVPRASDVGVIFEVMNNRGKPLSEMEKVKNYLLYLASKVTTSPGSDLAEQINETWRTVFEGLMQSDASGSFYEDQLLRAHWLMAYDHRPKEWSGNGSIKARFSLKLYQGKLGQLVADLMAYTESLRSFSVAYCDLIAPTRAGAFAEYRDQAAARDKLVRAARRLVRLEALASFLPMLGAIRLVCPGNAETYLSFLNLCEKYAFRVYRWAKRRANAGQTSLFKLGNDIYHGRVTSEDAGPTVTSYLHYYAPEADFRRELEAPSDWYNWHGIKYFLYEYEEHLARGKPVQLPWDVLARRDKKDSIEHVLPQTPTEPYWTERWSAEDIRTHLHDLGNLSLTFDNSSYGNKGFPDKKGSAGSGACYANSNMFMERRLAIYDAWTKEQCAARHTEIAAWAIERWAVPVADAGAVATAEVLEDDDDGA